MTEAALSDNSRKSDMSVRSVDGRIGQSSFARRGLRWIVIAITAIAVLAFPKMIANGFYIHIANLMLLNIIMVMGLWLIWSVGQLSLGHTAFAGLGGYISALLAMKLGVPPAFGIVIGAAAAAGVAALIGWIILRVRGVYFVLVTFLFAQTFALAALNLEAVTNGANGLVNIPPLTVFGWSLAPRANFYCVALGTCAAIYWFLHRLMNSNVGRAFRSIADNTVLAEASGVDVRRYQILAFAIGSGIAGLAGAMMVHYTRFLSPDTFTFSESVSYLTMLVVGGRAALVGAVLGALFITPLPELLRGFVGLQSIIYGAVMMAVVLFLPEGIMSLRSVVSGLGRHRRGMT
jgi:branched-chain amino acid transport system permease protein